MGGRGSSSGGGGGGGKLVSVSSIASRLIALPGGGKDKVRLARVAEGLKAGRDLGVVKLVRLPNGKLFVDNGRHRLLASHELGIPVRVSISRGVASAEHGTVPLISK